MGFAVLFPIVSCRRIFAGLESERGMAGEAGLLLARLVRLTHVRHVYSTRM
jgi:hypothetical protein